MERLLNQRIASHTPPIAQLFLPTFLPYTPALSLPHLHNIYPETAIIISMEIQNLNSEEERVLGQLTDLSQDIMAHSRSGREYKLKGRLTAAYSFVYNQCVGKPSKCENMFNKYKQLLSLHFIKSAGIDSTSNLFKESNRLWQGYILYASLMSKHAFAYLDRFFLPSRQHGNLVDVAVTIFDKHLFGNASKRQVYLQRFVSALGMMRKNMVVTENYLYDFIKQLYAINTDFYFQLKKAYFEETRLFYANKFSQSRQLDPISYYHRVNNLIYFEEAVSSLCLFWTREQNLKERVILPIIFTKQLIQPYTEILLTHRKGLQWALKQFNIPLLNIITDIYSKFQGFERIKKFYYDYVVEESRLLLSGLEKIKEEGNVVHCIAEFFQKHQMVLTVGFKKHQEMQVTLSNALEYCVGKWDKLPDILFHFCEKVISVKQFQPNAMLIRAVFEKMSSKDQFIHKCEAWVQATILSDKQDLTQEHSFVNYLHQLCGSENTAKLSKLFCDYIEENQGRASASPFLCKIISHHLWERRFKQEVAVCLTIPARLQQQWTLYLNNFQLTNSKKKLRLLPLSTRLLLQLRLNNNRVLNIKCNLLQACIILSLDERPKSQEELIAQLNTEKHLITSYVNSAKFILSSSDSLCIDWGTSEEGYRDYTQQFQEKSKFIKAIEQDRNILLEAGIVRLIKRRKEVSFQEIFDYLCCTIKLFRPQPHMVKASIEKLTKRDFIEPNEGVYVYKQ